MVVVPSRWEGMALVPLEAMACARSVVATDVNGVIDSVPPDAGAVVVLDDLPALVAALVARLEDRAPRRGGGLERPVPRGEAPRRDDVSA